jgi:hypothetical protein
MHVNDFTSLQTVIRGVREEILGEFRRKGENFTPIATHDIDDAVSRVYERLKIVALEARQQAQLLEVRAEHMEAFLGRVQLPGLLLAALTANRNRNGACHA